MVSGKSLLRDFLWDCGYESSMRVTLNCYTLLSHPLFPRGDIIYFLLWFFRGKYCVARITHPIRNISLSPLNNGSFEWYQSISWNTGMRRISCRDFSGGQWLESSCQCRDAGSTPGWGTRIPMPWESKQTKEMASCKDVEVFLTSEMRKKWIGI